MALTNTERQANFKKKGADLLQHLTNQNDELQAENARLRVQLTELTERAHRLEVAGLRAQLKKAQSLG